jgi:hypothetical protein
MLGVEGRGEEGGVNGEEREVGELLLLLLFVVE